MLFHRNSFQIWQFFVKAHNIAVCNLILWINVLGIKVFRSNSPLVTLIRKTDLNTRNFIYPQEWRYKPISVELSATALCCCRHELLNSIFQNHKTIFKIRFTFSKKHIFILMHEGFSTTSVYYVYLLTYSMEQSPS